MGVVRCTFQRGCSSESGMSSFSNSTSNTFAFFVVSGGATIVCNALTNGNTFANERPKANRLMPASNIRMDNMYFLCFIDENFARRFFFPKIFQR